MNQPVQTAHHSAVDSLDLATGLPVLKDGVSAEAACDPFLSTDHKLVVDMVRDFGAENLPPELVLGLHDRQEFCGAILEKLYSLELINLSLSEEMGGQGAGHLLEARVAEELAAFCSGVAASALANSLALKPIDIGGTAEQKDLFGKLLTRERGLASFCLTEPGAGSNPAQLITKLTPDGSGGFRLTGTKIWATSGGYAQQFTVAARLPDTNGTKGICVVAVPRGPGISTDKHENKLGQRASNAAEVVFDNVRVEADQIIGPLGNGFPIILETLSRARPNVAMIAVGIVRQALALAVAHAKEREQFGQQIAKHQAVQNHLADIYTELQAGRLLALHAARLHDLGLRAEATIAASTAKLFTCDLAPRAVMRALYLHGGTGYSREALVSKLYADAAVMPIYEGTSDIQRMIIARGILR